MSFQGAGGLVKFNTHRGVNTPVEVNWIMNGTERFVGQFNPLNPTNFQVRIAKTDLPEDTLGIEIFVIPLPGSVILCILATAVITLTTGQLALLIFYRNHKAVKATDPYLSLPMFTGCYLLCFSSVGVTTISSFDVYPLAYTIILNSTIFLAVNGLCLILITLFVKLLRILPHLRTTRKIQACTVLEKHFPFVISPSTNSNSQHNSATFNNHRHTKI